MIHNSRKRATTRLHTPRLLVLPIPNSGWVYDPMMACNPPSLSIYFPDPSQSLQGHPWVRLGCAWVRLGSAHSAAGWPKEQRDAQHESGSQNSPKDSVDESPINVTHLSPIGKAKQWGGGWAGGEHWHRLRTDMGWSQMLHQV